MADLRETAATIALLRRGDRPWSHYADHIETAGSAVALLNSPLPDDHDADALMLFTAEQAAPPPDLAALEDEIRQWLDEGMTLVTVLDDDYPENLRTIHDRPPILFVRGHLVAEDARSVSVVGTRTATPDGLRDAQRISARLVEGGYTVVSGLAEGIDTAAHTAALEAGGRTIAVVGTGLRRSYPAKNASLQARLAAETAVVSQFWPDQPPTKKTFPMRNVVMSGFALATVVVEASDTSGARMQARFALGHGRPVFLLRSLLIHEWARSYADLPGTFVIDGPEQVVEHLARLTSLDPLALA